MEKFEIGDQVIRKGRGVVGEVVALYPQGHYSVGVQWPHHRITRPVAYHAPEELELLSLER